MSLRVLHITSWYRSPEQPESVPFITEHFKALEKYCENDLVHVEVRCKAGTTIKKRNYLLSDKEEAFILEVGINRGVIIEWLTWRLLNKVFQKYRPNDKYDIVNFVIAYPLCVYTKKLKEYLNIPFVITEHWTAYYFNFNLPRTTKKLDRIKHIFKHNVPLVTVSNALLNDIVEFSGRQQSNYYVVPNVVNDCFNYHGGPFPEQPVFFMLNYWRKIKSPFILLKAFLKVREAYPDARLRVGGYGPLWVSMKNFVVKNNLSNNVDLLGILTKEEISSEMNGATAFIHASSYETFSVVTAEAICCGLPVVVSNLPAIREFVDESNGILISREAGDEEWASKMMEMVSNAPNYNRRKISEKALKRFSPRAVGSQYYTVLSDIITSYNE